ncbi:MAG: hypothetical protein JWM54_1517 [Acidobacteriaceae bacterium]|nr:hypothetical protein [Acidobacteriaceae bacterium]
MRVAITYNYSVSLGGSERVLEVLAAMYPEADLFCLMADPRCIPQSLRDRKIYTSFLDRVPFGKRFYQSLLPLYPYATESLNLQGYDIVISSDGTATKGVITDEGAFHLCYCHSPHRSLWDEYGSYQKHSKGIQKLAFTVSAHYVRQWDFSAAQRPTAFVANSNYVASRVQKYYRRDCEVIYPPIDARAGYVARRTDDYYLTVGRLSSKKCTEMIVQACTAMNRRLLIAGTGDQMDRLKKMAGPRVEFLGFVPDEALGELYSRCRAFIFASREDFGIAPVEAQSYGRPVIAFGQGGALESVKGWTLAGRASVATCTGLFFEHQTVASLSEAIREFESVEDQFDPAYIRSHSLRFDTSVFRAAIRNIVDAGAPSHHRLPVESTFIAQPEAIHA